MSRSSNNYSRADGWLFGRQIGACGTEYPIRSRRPATFLLRQAPPFSCGYSCVSARRAGDTAGGVTDAAHFKQVDNRIGVDHGYFCV